MRFIGKVGARSSNLSRAQVMEIKEELGIDCEVIWTLTKGDRDKKSSLKEMGKNDFFTKELDEMLLNKEIDAAVHSAKDLPDPLPKGLEVVYFSKGVDPRDSLVIHQEPIKLIGCSSVRREEMVKELFPDCTVVDIRGTIEERLKLPLDAVVIAEAALIRLKLTYLRRIFLPHETVFGQGKIAVVCRKNENVIPWAQSPSGSLSLSGH